jgi:hemerythrin-like metal-binding protein
MPLMTWKDEYSVKIQTIDLQHKKLIDLLNQIYDASRIGKGKEILGKILNELVTYTKVHFATEEEFFKKFSYPGFVQHKAEHDKLTKQVTDFQEQYASGRVTLSIEIMQFLKDWLNGHILGTDKKYTEFLNSKGLR